MFKLISIDPGKFKCGLILADLSGKKVYQAIILKSELIEGYVRNLNTVENISKIIIVTVQLVKILLKNWIFLKK